MWSTCISTLTVYLPPGLSSTRTFFSFTHSTYFCFLIFFFISFILSFYEDRFSSRSDLFCHVTCIRPKVEKRARVSGYAVRMIETKIEVKKKVEVFQVPVSPRYTERKVVDVKGPERTRIKKKKIPSTGRDLRFPIPFSPLLIRDLAPSIFVSSLSSLFFARATVSTTRVPVAEENKLRSQAEFGRVHPAKRKREELSRKGISVESDKACVLSFFDFLPLFSVSPELSGSSQRYVRRVLLSGIKKRFVVRDQAREAEEEKKRGTARGEEGRMDEGGNGWDKVAPGYIATGSSREWGLMEDWKWDKCMYSPGRGIVQIWIYY